MNTLVLIVALLTAQTSADDLDARKDKNGFIPNIELVDLCDGFTDPKYKRMWLLQNITRGMKDPATMAQVQAKLDGMSDSDILAYYRKIAQKVLDTPASCVVCRGRNCVDIFADFKSKLKKETSSEGTETSESPLDIVAKIPKTPHPFTFRGESYESYKAFKESPAYEEWMAERRAISGK
jgi:hypothetical protein